MEWVLTEKIGKEGDWNEQGRFPTHRAAIRWLAAKDGFYRERPGVYSLVYWSQSDRCVYHYRLVRRAKEG